MLCIPATMAKYRYRRVELGESVYFQQLTLSQQIVTSKKNEVKIQYSQTHNSFLEAKSFVPLFGTNTVNTAACKQYVKGMRGGGCLCIGKACRRVRSGAIQNASWQKLGLLFCNWSSYYLHLILLTLKEILNNHSLWMITKPFPCHSWFERHLHHSLLSSLYFRLKHPTLFSHSLHQRKVTSLIILPTTFSFSYLLHVYYVF